MAVDCHWTMLVFTVGHEVAHFYQMNTDRVYWGNYKKEAEFNAEKISYDILLQLIMEKLNQDLQMEEHIYLTPMMYMDMFEMMYCTSYILYGKNPSYGVHPSPEKRKEAMFELVEQECYQFDTLEGNQVYQDLNVPRTNSGF